MKKRASLREGLRTNERAGPGPVNYPCWGAREDPKRRRRKVQVETKRFSSLHVLTSPLRTGVGADYSPKQEAFESRARPDQSLTLSRAGRQIRESMRLWPVAATGSSRVAEQDIQAGPYLIPKGSKLVIPLLPLHRCFQMTLHPRHS